MRAFLFTLSLAAIAVGQTPPATPSTFGPSLPAALGSGIQTGPAATTAPGQAAPPRIDLSDQTVAATDVINVSVYGYPDLSRNVRVDRDGEIRLPMLNQRLLAAGLMPADIETIIGQAYIREGVLVDPYINVTIMEHQGLEITVAGAVRSPQVFQATRPFTLLELITRCGGLAPEAGKVIHVVTDEPGSDGKPVSFTRTIPVEGLMAGSDPTLNLVLNGGEEIDVPEADKIFVFGNVKSSGAFPVQKDDTTVFKILALAGGLTPYSTSEAYIYRSEPSGSRKEIPIELAKIMHRKSPDVPLMANDILYVPDSAAKRTAITTLDRISQVMISMGAYLAIYRP